LINWLELLEITTFLAAGMFPKLEIGVALDRGDLVGRAVTALDNDFSSRPRASGRPSQST